MKIIIKNLQKKIPINPKRIKSAVLKALSSPHASLKYNKTIKEGRGEITFCFVNDKKIKSLNREFLHKNYSTDVLSFDFSTQGKEIFADVVISTDTAVRNATIYKTSSLYEVYLYVVHGTLHLLGYDDKTKEQRKIMDQKAKEILKYVITKD
ncbi:MAG: rRNA maturation RNase YbeY [Omnitrophica WOR_2 bacterium RIFCSPLOWO2_01_FULL_41_12]|nr:MAG: rRNA maturation RNase YbeY [Omnitrophica WOR_2 bacterium RIFCSPLOWO2_01_FULL_41_12]